MLPAKSPDFGKLSKAVALDQQRTMRASERVWKASCKGTRVAATELLYSTLLYSTGKIHTFMQLLVLFVKSVVERLCSEFTNPAGGLRAVG